MKTVTKNVTLVATFFAAKILALKAVLSLLVSVPKNNTGIIVFFPVECASLQAVQFVAKIPARNVFNMRVLNVGVNKTELTTQLVVEIAARRLGVVSA